MSPKYLSAGLLLLYSKLSPCDFFSHLINVNQILKYIGSQLLIIAVFYNFSQIYIKAYHSNFILLASMESKRTRGRNS